MNEVVSSLVSEIAVDDLTSPQINTTLFVRSLTVAPRLEFITSRCPAYSVKNIIEVIEGVHTNSNIQEQPSSLA